MEGLLKYVFYFAVLFVVMTQVFPLVKTSIVNNKSSQPNSSIMHNNDVVFCEMEISNLDRLDLIANVKYDHDVMMSYKSENDFLIGVDNSTFSNLPEALNKMSNQDWTLKHSFTLGQEDNMKLRFLFEKNL